MRPKKTILCVDDNEQVLSIRKYLLETRGYRVLCAQNAQQAIEILERGSVDLVVCDLVMPGIDGNELVSRMKEIRPDVPTMLISGAVRDRERGVRADVFLPKGTCSPLELLERIRMMVARKRGPRKQMTGTGAAHNLSEAAGTANSTFSAQAVPDIANHAGRPGLAS